MLNQINPTKGRFVIAKLSLLKVFILFSMSLLTSCGWQKELNISNERAAKLIEEAALLQERLTNSQIERIKLDESIMNAQSKIEYLELDHLACSKELEFITDLYSQNVLRLARVKTELRTVFPNQLYDERISVEEVHGRLKLRLSNHILYTKGSDKLHDSAFLMIEELSKVLQNHSGLQIIVEGHTDLSPLKKGGKYGDNWDLSFARAVKIVRLLESYGVAPSRMTAAGKGANDPINSDSTAEAMAENRRTEIIITPNPSELFRIIDKIN